jgi:hypothetical protein
LRFESGCDNHSPLGAVAKDFRIAEVNPIAGQDGIALVFCPSPPFVARKSQALNLAPVTGMSKACDKFSSVLVLIQGGGASGENRAISSGYKAIGQCSQ